MNHYLEIFRSLKEPERKKVVAAAKWGDGPYTRLIFGIAFPKLNTDDIPALIRHFQAIEA
jgi:hypothetical protein